jgi:hypothetical protein
MAARVEHHITRSLDEHMVLIKQQVDRSLEDPETRTLAVKIVSGNYQWRAHRDRRSGRVREVPMIRAWGKWFLAPDMPQCEPRDETCEMERIWEFAVLNVRYVYDPDEIDFFATAKETLLAGGGDCDDLTILIASLAKAIGFKSAARVVSTSDAPEEWVHVYPLLGLNSKDSPKWWVPLDTTVTGSKPGWQYPDIARHADYQM